MLLRKSRGNSVQLRRFLNAASGRGAPATKGEAVVLRLQGVALDATTAEADGPKWQQVALEGTYKGYAGGTRPFAFTKEIFDRIVANFRSHPSYAKGADGVGQNAVVAWDFHHASEAEPTSGVIPSSGAPAQGWVHELDVRTGADGKSELWALTKWLPTAREYVKAGAYKWASVAVVFNAVDSLSGVELGPVLTSIALTNMPFIEGMQELAAGGPDARRELSRLGYYEQASTPKQAVEELCRIFSLPATAGLRDVLGQVGLLQQQITTGTIPFGVDADEIMGCIRRVLNLRTLSSNEEVFTELQLLVARLLESQTVGGEHPAPAAAPTPSLTVSKQGTNEMNLLQVLAAKLGLKETDEAVIRAVESLLLVRKALVSALGLNEDANDATLCRRIEGPQGVAQALKLCAAFVEAQALVAATKLPTVKADRVTASATLQDKLLRIFKAASVENPEQYVSNFVTGATAFAELQEVMPELEGLRKAQADQETEEEAEDVAAAMERQGHQLDARTGQPTNNAGKILFTALQGQRKAIGREKFREAFELDVDAEERTELTQTYAAEPGGTPKVIASRGGAGAPPPPKKLKDGQVDLATLPGVNDGDKANKFVASQPYAKGWDWEHVCVHAAQLRDQGVFVNTAARA